MKLKILNYVKKLSIALLSICLIVTLYEARIYNVQDNKRWLNQSYGRAKQSENGRVKDSGCIIEYIKEIDDVKVSGENCKFKN